MKTNKFLLGALAFLSMGVMASCSNEDGPVINDGGEQTGDRYMAVRISSMGNSGTRADEDEWNQSPAGDGYEVGTDQENKIKADDVRFYFFTDKQLPFILSASGVNGDVTPTNMVKPIKLGGEIQDGNLTSSIEGVLVLGKAEDQAYVGKTPSYVLCAANLSETEFQSLANKSLEDLYEMKVHMTDPTKFGFKMTSTTYLKKNAENTFDGGGYDRVICSLIPDGSICDKPEDAQKHPVEIYIERQVVKVRTVGLDTYPAYKKDTEDNTYEFVSSADIKSEKTLKVKLTGWQLRNTTDEARMFKNISKTVNYFNGWNDEAYHRSHWAITPFDLVGDKLLNQDYDIYSEAQFKNGNFDSSKPSENIAYTYPNTTYSGYVGNADFNEDVTHPASLTDRTTGATAVVIRGQVGEEVDGVFTPLDMVRWAGSYYVASEFRTFIAAEYDKSKGNPVGTTTADMVKFVDSEKSVLSQPNKHDIEINDGTNTAKFERIYNVEYWANGLTSYYVNIKHATNPAGQALYGTVRNHIYEHEVTGVFGLGVPGNEPENPQKEDESFVACRLNVLNWGIVKNSIVLE